MGTGPAARDIRESFLAFFEGKAHQRVASAPLLPESDPTLLFVNAGMVPFKRVFLGEEKRDFQRAASSQKCMRVSGKHNDLENVGRTPRHHTFFEMLGNFSFGDYFKEGAIQLAWELVNQRWGIAQERVAVSVFREDDEAARLWESEAGFAADRIYRLDEDENFWSMGDTGPCGPCSELHLDFGPTGRCEREVCDPSCDCGRWLEFWNLVFMQFNRDAQGRQTPLPRPSVDTGAGLERVAAILQGVRSNYETDLFTPILARAQELSGVELGSDPERDVSLRVVADHARAVTFLIGDGVLPGNEGRGYVLRRILRRASRHGVLLGLEGPFLHRVAEVVIDEMAGAYPELAERRAYVTDRVQREEERFLETLSKGLALLEEEIAGAREQGLEVLPGPVVFKLYDTYGFPVDLTEDIVSGQGLRIDQSGFDSSMSEQRERSREAWKGSGDMALAGDYASIAERESSRFLGYESLEASSPVLALLRDGRSVEEVETGDEVEVVVAETPFYPEGGGQVGDRGSLATPAGRVEVHDTRRPIGELIVHRGKVVEGRLCRGETAELAVDAEARAATVRNHSGTHLLHAALREVLGPQAMQKGSLVAPDRLRFDFTHDAPLSEAEIEAIEDRVNRWIEANSPARIRRLPYKEAIEAGAVAIFEEKYGDEVRVVSFGEVSTELCGGTHATATGDIGLLKIVGETGIAAGVRRVEALTGLGALLHLRQQERRLRHIAELLKVPAGETEQRIERLLEERRAAEREIAELKRARVQGSPASAAADWEEIDEVSVYRKRLDGLSAKDLRGVVDDLRGQRERAVVCLASAADGKVSLAIGVTPALKARIPAGELMRSVSGIVGGKGGGRPDFAQGGGTEPEKIDEALERFVALVREKAT